MSWRNYADFYRRSEYGAFPQEHRRSIGRLPFNMIHVEQEPHNFSDPAVSETVLALPLAVPTECNWRWTIDGRSYRDIARPGGMLVVPAEVESHWEVDGSRRLLILSIPHVTVQGVLGSASPNRIRDAFWALGERAWVDSFVEPLVLRLWEASGSRDPLAGRMADGIVTTILSHLLLRAGGCSGTGPPVALARWRFKRVQDYVDNHLDEPIGIDQMSAAAKLSPRHFARSFAAEFGITPHKWLMRRRLDRAQDMLMSSEDPLCDIAQACGFSSQSHLTSLMKREAGTTPQRWRQNNRA